MSEELLPVFEFDRYRDGELKAEGIRITQQRTLLAAISKATTLAEPGDVLVLRPTPAASDAEMADRERAKRWILGKNDNTQFTREELLASEFAAVRREERERAKISAGNAKLPAHYQWGSDAMESFNFGIKCAVDAIRADASQEKKGA